MKQYFNVEGVNTYSNPLLTDGQLIHAVNVVSEPYGAKSKRPGYITYLGTANGSAPISLWSYRNDTNSLFYVYRQSGNQIYYSTDGTVDWVPAENGTVNASARVGAATFDNTMILGDGTTATRHTTNGTSFTDGSLAPKSNDFAVYQNRVYAKGTASDVFYSTTNDATNWNTSGTSDSSSFKATGEGILRTIFKASDRIVQAKTGGGMLKWDGYAQVDMSTNFGPSSQWSKDKSENYWFWINELGHYGYSGGRPQLLSNAVERQFYNRDNTGIAGTHLPVAQGVCHRYDYLVTLGTVTDNFTRKTIQNAILKYDFQKNEYLNWKFAHFPQSFHSFKDKDNVQQLIFGDANGQVYKLSGTATSDAGLPIESEMILVFNYGAPEYPKTWRYWRGIFNPGCQAKVQYATANYFDPSTMRWKEARDISEGICEFRIESEENAQSLFLFIRIYESSAYSRWTYLGCSIDADVEVRR